MYSARITREHKTAFIILSDRSGSMSEEVVFAGRAMTKADAVAHIINMFVDELINRSRREEGVRDYFDIAILGYGDDGVASLLSPEGELSTTTELVRRAVPVRRFETQRILPGGNTVSAIMDQKCWIEARSSGSTPMGAALLQAGRLAGAWCAAKANRKSFPPVVINVTDGEASDAVHEELKEYAGRIKECCTEDGAALLFNIHLAPAGEGCGVSVEADGAEAGPGISEASFPCSPDQLPGHRYARLLYDLSSEIPECYNNTISSVRPGSFPPYRAMSYNCAVEELFQMLTIGSLSVSIIV